MSELLGVAALILGFAIGTGILVFLAAETLSSYFIYRQRRHIVRIAGRIVHNELIAIEDEMTARRRKSHGPNVDGGTD